MEAGAVAGSKTAGHRIRPQWAAPGPQSLVLNPTRIFGRVVALGLEQQEAYERCS